MCLIASTESREGLGAREPQGKGLPQYPHAEDPMESLQVARLTKNLPGWGQAGVVWGKGGANLGEKVSGRPKPVLKARGPYLWRFPLFP